MSTDHSHLEDWTGHLSVIDQPAPISYFDDSITAAKVALDSSIADCRSACTMPAAAIVKQTIPCEIQMEGDRPMIPANSSRGISIREIQQTVALAFDLSVREMVSPCRRRHVTCARHIAMYLSREMAVRGWRAVSRTAESRAPVPPSFPRIGIAFARDHSSVIHACTMVKRRLRDDLGFALLLNRLAGDLRDHALAAATAREAI
jgi:chromosomal replication initiation ATPase DnaA